MAAATTIAVEPAAGLGVTEEMPKAVGGAGSEAGVLALESEEERESRIRALFDEFDNQKVGYLESKQIESRLQSLAFPFQKKYALEMVEACDVNRDGRIDYVEFRRYMDAKEVELFKLFEAIDVSRDGALQPEELHQALQNSGLQALWNLAHIVSCANLR